ncbi:hypothetical protein AB0A71_04745 [Kitasatospora aureofaciens]|uniref:hypothetical protein n=1 Tax=Kitasatospora aureofaciens TaxID=1894 RepID=UPI003406F793
MEPGDRCSPRPPRSQVGAVGGVGDVAAVLAQGGELEVSRSTAYRLLDLAAAAEAIEDVVGREAGPQLSHVWDTALSVRAVVEIRGRLAELAGLVAERSAQARAEAGGAQLEPGRISAAVTAAVTELRERPDVPTAELDSGPGPDGYPVEAWRTLVARGHGLARDRLDTNRELGLLALQVVPGTSPSGTPRRFCTSWPRRSAQQRRGTTRVPAGTR